jgi:hypothetical protein
MVSVLLVVSFWVNPVMNDARSGREFIERVERAANPRAPLGFVAFKEQYLLNARRPVVHFGHARWREGAQETMDAAHWMSLEPKRQLVVNRDSLDLCFKHSQRLALGSANRRQWFLVHGAVEPKCVERGALHLTHLYNPPLSTSANIVPRRSSRSRTQRE